MSAAASGTYLASYLDNTIKTNQQKDENNNKPQTTQNAVAIAFRHRSLTSKTAGAEIALLSLHNIYVGNNIRAIDFSYNKIDNFPQGLPLGLKALNLSYNGFSGDIKVCSPIPMHLIELQLSNNQIER